MCEEVHSRNGRADNKVGVFENAQDEEVDANAYAKQQLSFVQVTMHECAPDPVEEGHRHDQQDELWYPAHVEDVAGEKQHRQSQFVGQNPEQRDNAGEKEQILECSKQHLRSPVPGLHQTVVESA